MKVTVCELSNQPDTLAHEWDKLVEHVKHEQSDLLLLPEMPFHPWLAWTDKVDPALWQAASDAHDKWLPRLKELAPTVVLGSRPVIKDGARLNEGFVHEPTQGYRAAHTKYYLPDEEGFWEATWYQRGSGQFDAIEIDSLRTRVGFMICTDLWFTEHARAYGRQGVHLIVTPRATEKATLDKWLVGGRAAAILSGAYCLSSNPVTADESRVVLGGQGWIITPDGEVLVRTSHEQPFVTVEIDLNEAERAKQTYPRYVSE